ncbi:MAG: Asp-tRNA(Asn)/Glu-tRNA(Gln) amidotransferase GatCAB subunit A [Acidobacteriia bacterium]|nr:Asp-tRNA(Asn)/Glu-tRNA(Gln) amidotransferase GatCAB subunit A [Terriglobia bacterium]
MTNEGLLAFATIEELAARLAKHEVSPVNLTEQFLRRIERHNPQLNAYLTVTAERALTAARRAEKELTRSRSRPSGRHRPLLGIPIALKDNIWTRGIRTTAGSKVMRDFVPAEDATVARKLARAGAILLGKTNMHEFAYGITNNNAHYGPVHNPWGLDRISGGSSGGSAAAIAAGLCVASVGTDTGGSIRIPSAMCGIVGLKPTFGRVSVYGTVPLAPTFDHVGPLARSVADAAILLGLLAGRDPLDPASSARRVENFSAALCKPIRKFRLGRPREYFWEKLDGEVRHATEAAVRDMEKHGATVREISLPHLGESVEASTNISLAETRHFHEAAGYFPAHADEYSEEVRQRLDAGGNVLAVKYLDGLAAQKRVRAEFDAAFREVDAIIAPTVPVPAPPIGAEFVDIDGEQHGVRPALVGMNRPANFTGHPAISVPCGFTRDGLPVGLQLIGRAFDEATLLRIALSYERAHGWRVRHPRID